jgi:hypothetical protein
VVQVTPAAPVQPVAQDAQEKCRIEDVPAKGGLVPTPPADLDLEACGFYFDDEDEE